jgi:RNA polymerase sigma factor (sigma-70 family)
MTKLLAAYSDDELLAGCIKNDRRYQQRFYERFYGKMMSLCSRYCNNREDALELLNSGFLKVFLNIKAFKSEGSLEGWVRRIVLNHILEEHRKHLKYRDTIVYPENEKDGEADGDAISDLNAKDIINMIGLLPASSRLVFNLFAIEGFSHQEISERLKISTGTSKWHVSFAREKLKKMINDSKIKEDRYVKA